MKDWLSFWLVVVGIILHSRNEVNTKQTKRCQIQRKASRDLSTIVSEIHS